MLLGHRSRGTVTTQQEGESFSLSFSSLPSFCLGECHSYVLDFYIWYFDTLLSAFRDPLYYTRCYIRMSKFLPFENRSISFHLKLLLVLDSCTRLLFWKLILTQYIHTKITADQDH